jgi:hypothetical protein
MAHLLDIHWVTGMDTGYPYPRKNIHGYFTISITVPADTKFHHTHIQWIIIRGYLPIPVSIAIPSLVLSSASHLPVAITPQIGREKPPKSNTITSCS